MRERGLLVKDREHRGTGGDKSVCMAAHASSNELTPQVRGGLFLRDIPRPQLARSRALLRHPDGVVVVTLLVAVPWPASPGPTKEGISLMNEDASLPCPTAYSESRKQPGSRP
jgi:hypothetical protein